MTFNPELEARIRRAERASPLTQLDRREIVAEIRQLKLLRDTHPELAIRCYTRMNVLLDMLDADGASESEEALDRMEETREVDPASAEQTRE